MVRVGGGEQQLITEARHIKEGNTSKKRDTPGRGICDVTNCELTCCDDAAEFRILFHTTGARQNGRLTNENHFDLPMVSLTSTLMNGTGHPQGASRSVARRCILWAKKCGCLRVGDADEAVVELAMKRLLVRNLGDSTSVGR